MKKYIVWYKASWSAGWRNEEYDTPAEIANAILSGEINGKETIITRRMALNIIDAEEAPVTVASEPEGEPIATPQPEPEPIAVEF